MRDKNRIPKFLKTLESYWSLVPDWRFGQFMVNFLGSLDRDPFFYEDDEIEKKLKGYFDKLRGNKK